MLLCKRRHATVKIAARTAPPELELYTVRQTDIQTELMCFFYYTLSFSLSIISEPQQYSQAEANNHSASKL